LWAGDSRAYLLRAGRLHRLTRDHSQVQEMIDRGLIAPEAAAGHPMGHVLSRAVGVEPSVEVASVIDTAADGDVFLLCSDGLHGVLTDDEIAAVLDRAQPDVPATLIRHCLARGAPDNVTIVTVALDETTALIFQPADAVI
jgi:serine/threonine protein phosphatase PrpC